MTTERNIEILTELGQQLGEFTSPGLEEAIRRAGFENGWFREDQVHAALSKWQAALSPENVAEWIRKEKIAATENPRTVGIIMAGNIPLVGLYDLLCVLITGHKAKIKLSADDRVLMEFVISILKKTAPEWSDNIEVAERLHHTDAVIATGSNNTSRYFEYYFGKQPHIIRKNRNSVAILTGNESAADLYNLGEDIFRYFGLGCRNVTKIYVPRDYSLPVFLDGIAAFSEVINQHKYANNYIYHKAILLMNLHPHLDNDFLLVKEDTNIYSPIGCLNYERYDSLPELARQLASVQEQIQVIAGDTGEIAGEVPFGHSQEPRLWDYADGINTVAFCMQL